jgi:hypothetical protein
VVSKQGQINEPEQRNRRATERDGSHRPSAGPRKPTKIDGGRFALNHLGEWFHGAGRPRNFLSRWWPAAGHRVQNLVLGGFSALKFPEDPSFGQHQHPVSQTKNFLDFA